jgi:glycosyltransferase involved in cell wall biosynthesis
MKILYQSASYIPSYAANSVHVMNMVDEISKLDHDVKLLSFCSDLDVEGSDNSYYGVGDGFEVIKYPFKTKINKIKYIYDSLIYARKFKPDLIISRFPYGAYALLLFGYNVVLDAHGPLWKGSFLKKCTWRVFSKFENLRVTTNSVSLKEMFVDENVCPKHNIKVAFNGAKVFPLDTFYDLKGKKEFNAGYIGGLYAGRGIDIIVEIAKSLPQIGFHIAGGALEDIEEVRSQYKIPSNIIFYGHLNPAEVYKFRNSCDVLLAPYHKSGIVGASKVGDSSQYMNPIKIFEYLSSSKVVIASDLKPIREVVSKEEVFLVEPDNIEKWIDTLMFLSTHPETCKDYANRSYSIFLKKFTWKVRALKLLNMFNS